MCAREGEGISKRATKSEREVKEVVRVYKPFRHSAAGGTADWQLIKHTAGELTHTLSELHRKASLSHIHTHSLCFLLCLT